MNLRIFRRGAQRLAPFLLLAVLVPLVGVLAVLQYLWTGQVSAVEQDRMRKNLNAVVGALVGEFEASVTAPALAYQMDADTYRRGDWRGYTERARMWMEAGPFIVRAVLLLAEHDLRLDLASRTFQPVSDPADRAAAAAVHADIASMRGPDGAFSAVAPTVLMLPDIPAFVMPILDLASDGGAATSAGVIAVLLDREAVETRLLPELLGRYLADGTLLRDYRVQVSRAEDGAVIFSNDQGWKPGSVPSMARQVDIVVPLLGTKAVELLVQPKELAAINSLSAGSETGGAVVRLVRKLSTAATVGAVAEEKGRIFFSSGLSAVAKMPPDLSQGGWVLTASHRAGSLDALVRQHRTRNLGLGLGILAVLALGLAASALSARRSRVLARRERDFIAGVTHELKTPIAAICSAGENLSDGLVTERPRLKEYGRIIVEEGRRLQGMVEKVLRYAAIQRPRAVPREVIDVRALLAAACQAVAPECSRRDIRLERDFDGELPLLRGDPEALRSAVTNLLANAVIHGGSGGWIGVSAGVRGSGAGRTLVVRVADRGPGIERDELVQVFEPFYRGRRAIEDQLPGAGIGLSLAREIARSHGGALEVSSAPGKGATFIFTVPAP